MATKKEFSTRLLKITTEKFAIFEDNYQFKEGSTPNKDLITKLQVKFGASIVHKQIAVIFSFELTHNDCSVLIVEPAMHFMIDADSWDMIYKEENKEVVLPNLNAVHLLGLCISTARGILHAKTEGTKFNGLFIPLMQPSLLIEDEVKIKIVDDFNKIPTIKSNIN